MDDYSWMYRVSLKGLRNMDYCNEVESFIKYTLSNPKIISGGGIRYLCKSFKNKKFINLNVITMYLLQKKVLGEILVFVNIWRTICSLRDHDKKDG